MRQAASQSDAQSLPSEVKLNELRQFDRITKRCRCNLNLVFNVLLWIHRYKHQLKSKRLVLVLLKLKSRRLHLNLVFKSERETFTSLGSCSIWVKNEWFPRWTMGNSAFVLFKFPISAYFNVCISYQRSLKSTTRYRTRYQVCDS